jgi:phage repressor protein C with HTH and peptisase S24 domain
MSERAVIQGWIKSVLKDKGWNAKEWSGRAGVASTTITRFMRDPEAPMISSTSIEKLKLAAGAQVYAQATPNAEIITMPLPPRSEWPRDLPVLGTAAGSSSGSFQLSSGVVDYLLRPPGLVGSADVYAIFVEGDSMWPRWESGDPVVVHPHRPPKLGDCVILVVQENGETTAYVKLLLRVTSHEIEVKQFNPEKILKFQKKNILKMHRVVPFSELLGV